MITLLVPSGGLVMVVVLANDSDQNSVVVTVGLYGSLMITLLVPSGGLVTVVVLANDSDQNSVIVVVGSGSGICTITVSMEPVGLV